jgi:mannose-6-phosphate isomerase-like protein (cupin superfamily)/predicted ester cyclase
VPRIAVLFALVLMLLTGLTVGSLSALDPARQPADAIQPPSAATSRTGVAFYDAIDTLLATGDSSGLRTIVHPNFADHSHLSNEPGTRETLEAWLLSIRESTPDLRFSVSEVVAQNDLIAVDLQQTGAPESTIAGLPVTVAQGTSGYELLRIKNGLVVERWASPALPGQIDPSVASLDALVESGWIREPRIERLEIPHKATLSSAGHMGTVLIVESGALNLSIPGLSHSELLEPGEIRTIPPETRYNIWNRGQEPVSVISLTILQLTTSDYSSSHSRDIIETGGVQRHLLAGGASIRPDHGPFQLRLGHALVAPGTAIPAHKVNELEMLFVTSGTVEARLDQGWVFSLTDLGGLETESDVATVGPDQAISAGFNTEVSYEVTGTEPTEFWLITVMPEE